MSTLLIAPPMQRFMGFRKNLIPLGLLYAAQAWPDVTVYDADYNPTGKAMGFVEKVEAYHKYLDALEGKHEVWDEIRGVINEVRPDVVGVTVLSSQLTSAFRVAKIARECGAKQIVAGGPHATLRPNEFLEVFDVVICGEGDRAWPLPEWGTFGTERIRDLDGLRPKRSALYHKHKPDDLAVVMTSRGCPNACAFCCSPSLWGRKVVFRSVSDVLAEVDEVKKYKPSKISFWDDTFTCNPARLLSLCRGLRPRNVHWECLARCDTITPKTAKAMKDSGCQLVKVGVESGSDKVLSRMRKLETVEGMEEAAKVMHAAGLPFLAYFMIGTPHETPEDWCKTANLMRRLRPTYASLSVYTPYPGTYWSNGKAIDYWRYNHHSPDSYVLHNREFIHDAFAEVDAYNAESHSQSSH